MESTAWKPFLPPMKTKRSDASAVNTGSPEYLVVVGGISNHRWTTAVEVLVDDEWFTVQPLPGYPNYPRAHIYNGNLIVTETYRTSYSSWHGGCCRLNLLLAPCFQSQGGENETKSSSDVWKKFPRGSTHCILSFGQQLVAVSGKNLEILCPATHTWLKMPSGHFSLMDGAILPTGEMMMVGYQGDYGGFTISKASLKSEYSCLNEDIQNKVTYLGLSVHIY